MQGEVVRLGVGAGFSGDRLEPAVQLAELGRLDFLVFECLAERTIGLAQLSRLEGLGPGFDPLLAERIRTTLSPARAHDTVLITNAGAANPPAAGEHVLAIAKSMGFDEVTVAVVTGDDVLPQLDLEESLILGSENTENTLAQFRGRIVSANAYLGAEGIIEALQTEPAVVITGRTSDVALFLAPLMHRFGWLQSDYQRLADGALVGHLLECAGQLSGGYFADGDRKNVQGLARLGFPLAEVAADGTALVTKLPGTGGRIDRMTCLEQMLYEVDDPRAYITPDVVLDLTNVHITETNENEVRISGVLGSSHPERLKVSVGIRDGFVGEAEISYAGPGCLRRAMMAEEIIRERWREIYQYEQADLRRHIIGVNACRPWLDPAGFDPPEVRLRLSVRSLQREQAVILAREVEALYTNGPAGGGGVTTKVRSSLGIVSTTIPRDAVQHSVRVLS
jgi:hypothetical protein